jgi:S1-C subfamily serine protease
LGPNGSNIGIGFAVPISLAKPIMNDLIRHGSVTRGPIGVAVEDLTPDIASSLGLKRSQGVVVARVAPGSAADRAGLQPGDVVTAINGAPISSSAELRNQVGLSHVGDTLTLSTIRNGEAGTAKVTIDAERSSEHQPAAAEWH